MLWYPSDMIEIQVIKDWVIERLEGDDQFADGYPVAILGNAPGGGEEIRAALVFSNYSGKNVFMAGASDANGWLSPRDIADTVSVPFRPPLNVLRVTALVSKANKRSARLIQAFGFTYEGTLRDYEFEGSETLVYGLTRADFFGGKYGRKTSDQHAESNKRNAWTGGESVRRGLFPGNEPLHGAEGALQPGIRAAS